MDRDPEQGRGTAMSQRARQAPGEVNCDAVDVFAESQNVSVYRCAMGCLHFTIGPVAMRLTPAEFAEIAAVVLCAAEQMQTPRLPQGVESMGSSN